MFFLSNSPFPSPPRRFGSLRSFPHVLPPKNERTTRRTKQRLEEIFSWSFFSFAGFRKSDRREHRVPATKTPRFRVRAILQKKTRVKRERDDGRFAPENASESAPPRRLIRRRLATDAEPARGENASSENRPPHDRRQECLRPQRRRSRGAPFPCSSVPLC